MRWLAHTALAATVACTLTAGVTAGQNLTADIGSSAFESYLDLLRQQVGIPAISGVLIEDGVVVWERGLGFANVESRIRATPDTPYPTADLTQTLASVLLLQCVEQRHLSLDAPLRTYGVSSADATSTLRQVLSHTSPAVSGTGFRYDPERFAQLTTVMEHCAPQSFRKSVAHRLLEFLAMMDSVPGRDLQNSSVVPEGLFTTSDLERYARVLERVAVPYKVDSRRRPSRTDVPIDTLNAATGLVSTVRDLARFDEALDSHDLLLEETLTTAWSQTQLPDHSPAPTGLGWFVQTYKGTKIVWHFGAIPNAYSALMVKVPSRRATMILLANSDGLAVPFQLENGDVTRSLFAAVFLRMLL
jgi:CubicO group peptidase (beta-lactamase class C family)